MNQTTLTRVAIAGAASAALAAFSVVSLRTPRLEEHAHDDELLVPADVIYTGGTIITLDDGQTMAEAVALKDGRILAVGARADVLKHRDDGTDIIDLRGRTMTPGFIDGHSHITRFVTFWGLPELAPPPVGNVSSIDDMIAKLRNYIADHTLPAGQAVVGYNYDETQLLDQRHPSAADLDRVSTEHPVIVFHVSGNLAVANHSALQRAGFVRGAKNPRHGRILRDAHTQEPTGVVEGEAAVQLLALIPPRTLDQQLATLDQVQRMYASQGITTASDGATSAAGLALLQAAAEHGRLMLDIVAYPSLTAADTLPAAGGYANQLKIGGWELAGDGWLQEKTAYLSEPYLTPPKGAPANYRGRPAIRQEELNQSVARAYAAGRQILVSCNGDACTDMMIAAVRNAEAQYGWKDLRPVLLHAQVLRDDQLDALKTLGIVPSFFSVATYYWGDRDIRETLGRARSQELSPMVAAAHRNIPAANHTDAPVTPPDQLFLMHSAVNRTTRSGVVLGTGQRSSPIDALKAITSHGAYMYFEEKSKGTIAPGKRADLVVLSRNPLEVPRTAIKDIRVLKTIKDGLLVYDATSSVVLAVR